MNGPISSLQNERVKRAVKLRDRRGREKQGRIVIDGVREIARALAGGTELLELFYCLPPDSTSQSDQARDVITRAADEGAECLETTSAVFTKLAYGNRNEGLVATARPPRRSLADLQLGEAPLMALLEGVEKPGNVGAILRSADAAGVSAVIVVDGGTDLFNPNAIRASLGAIFTLPVCTADAPSALKWLREGGYQILTARVDAQEDYCDQDYRQATAIVLGSEQAGLSPVWQGDDVQPIRLPMQGTVDSLNVSATAAVLFYEALRQRRDSG